MKYFKNLNGEVYAYEADGSQDEFILEGLILISEEEALELTAPLEIDPRQFIEVSAFQAHAAIARSGLYDPVEALMWHEDTPLETKLAWNKAQSFKRLSPTVLAMSAALGLTDKQIDELFALAATIEA